MKPERLAVLRDELSTVLSGYVADVYPEASLPTLSDYVVVIGVEDAVEDTPASVMLQVCCAGPDHAGLGLLDLGREALLYPEAEEDTT